MPAQKGKDLLLKIDDGASGFVTVAGLRTRQLAFNAEPVDVTHAESAGRWRELLAGAGVRRAGITGSGVFKDEASDARMRQVFFDGDVRTYQVIVPDFGRIEEAVPDRPRPDSAVVRRPGRTAWTARSCSRRSSWSPVRTDPRRRPA